MKTTKFFYSIKQIEIKWQFLKVLTFLPTIKVDHAYILLN